MFFHIEFRFKLSLSQSFLSLLLWLSLLLTCCKVAFVCGMRRALSTLSYKYRYTYLHIPMLKVIWKPTLFADWVARSGRLQSGCLESSRLQTGWLGQAVCRRGDSVRPFADGVARWQAVSNGLNKNVSKVFRANWLANGVSFHIALKKYLDFIIPTHIPTRLLNIL